MMIEVTLVIFMVPMLMDDDHVDCCWQFDGDDERGVDSDDAGAAAVLGVLGTHLKA